MDILTIIYLLLGGLICFVLGVWASGQIDAYANKKQVREYAQKNHKMFGIKALLVICVLTSCASAQEFYYKVPTTAMGDKNDPAIKFVKQYSDPNVGTTIVCGDKVAIVKVISKTKPVIYEGFDPVTELTFESKISDSRISMTTIPKKSSASVITGESK